MENQPTMTRSPIADELERRMALLGLTQKALARNAGVGDTYVRDILKGKSRNPGGEKLERIAAILGCTARDLLFPLRTGQARRDSVGADGGFDRQGERQGLMGRDSDGQQGARGEALPPLRREASVGGSGSLAPSANASGSGNVAITGESRGTTSGYAPAPDQPDITVELNPPGYVAVPFISLRAGMGGCGYVEDRLLGRPKFFEEEFVRGALRAQPADLRVIEVEGQSMEPMLQNGDMVLVDTRKTSIIEPGIFVLFDGDGVVCKWVERAHEATEPMIRIKSENPRFSPYVVPAEQVQVIGRVVWFARRL